MIAIVESRRILAWLLIGALACGGAIAVWLLGPGLERNSSVTSLFTADSAARRQLAELAEVFGTDDLLLVAIEDAGPDPVFSTHCRRYLENLVAALEAHPAVEAVVSLANIEEVRVRRVAGTPIPLPPRPLLPPPDDWLAPERRRAIVADPFLTQGLLSADGRTAVCWVLLDRSLRHAADYLDQVSALIDAIPPPPPAQPTLRLRITGFPLVQRALFEQMWRDGVILVAAALILVAAVALFGGVRPTAVLAFLAGWPLIVGLLVLWFHSSGRPLHAFSNSLLPLLVVTTGTVLIHLGRSGEGREGFAAVLRACLLTTATTAIGFSCLLLSAVPALTWLGTEAVVGTAVAFGVTALFVFLAGAARRRPRRSPLSQVPSRLRVPVAGGVVVGLLALPWFLLDPARLGWQSTLTGYLPDDHPAVTDARAIEAGIGSMATFDVVVRLPDAGSATEPDFYLRMAALEEAIGAAAGGRIGFILSPVSLIAYLNTRLAEESGAGTFAPTRDAAEFAIRWLIRPYLALGSDAAPDPAEPPPLLLALRDRMHPFLSDDGRRLRLICRLLESSPKDLIALRNRLESEVFPHARSALGAEEILATGYALAFAETTVAVRVAQIRALVFGGCLLGLLLLVILRSLRLWAVTILTNLCTITGTLTLLWIFAVDLNLYSTVLMATLLGILADDSLHFLLVYRHARATATRPARAALEEVSPRIRLTSLGLALGFAAFALSPLPLYRDFALAAAAAIALALFWDLKVLPVVVDRLDPGSG